MVVGPNKGFGTAEMGLGFLITICYYCFTL
jgi:hypothetical protein